MRREVFIGYCLILTLIMGLTVWRVIYYERHVAPRSAALRLGEFLIPLPIGTQVMLDGGRVHCHLVINKDLKEYQIGVAYVEGHPEDIVKAREANGWLVRLPLQEEPMLGPESLSLHRVVFTKPGRQLGYYFVRPKHGDRRVYLVMEWLCDEKNCADMQGVVQQLLKSIEVQ